ncbi:MAG: aminotransferase class I/II-fold pyridoxal phosphate-dependent enzyme [Desulfobacterales bacterium]|jgi:aspartate/methionine/tyrosine aminotransferase
MKIRPFAIERYFAKYEFTARYLLSSSDCESFSLAEVLEMADAETKRLWDQLKLEYTETLGHPLLRGAIAEIYQGIHMEDIIVVVPEEGIFLLMHAILEPGDHVVCTFPAYQSLYEVAQSIGCEVSKWEPDESNGWCFDVEQLEEKLQDNTRLVVVNFPHNPTGYVPPAEDYKALINIVRQRNIYLLSDEMYRFLEVDYGATLPAGCELYDQAFSLGGLSKTFGLPGLRIGWIVSRNHDVLERVSQLKDYTTICNSAPSEILAIMALRNKDKIIGLQKTRVDKNLKILDDFLGEYADCFSWNRPLGGSICFPRSLISQNTFEFCEELVQETGIMLLPSRMFMFGDNHLRVGYGRENLPDVVNRFADYLNRRVR